MDFGHLTLLCQEKRNPGASSSLESFWYHDVESAFVLQVVGDFGQIRRFSNAVDPEKHDRIPALPVASFSPLGRANEKQNREKDSESFVERDLSIDNFAYSSLLTSES